MSRAILHKTKIEEFKKWLDDQGIDRRDGSGDYQVMQVRMKKNGFAGVYWRHNMPEHYTTDPRIDGLVKRFCRESKLVQE